ncbi:HNH endonuclease [Halorubrum salinarum]|uniref:HNH endonuclease n=2 Tax=Halorubrum salinarum TaxID=2739057 RepID=A0A7D4C2M1_9EURY|nr:HNH endonuclease [Halorubrum salinarum]
MSKSLERKSWTEQRNAVFARDQQRCTCCLGRTGDVQTLDPDHNVPRGAGGSDRLSNLSTLCRRCHEAKHGDGIAPTVRLESTGEMTDVEFWWFKHLLKEMIPALAEDFNVRLQPKFGLEDDKVWYLPLGDIRLLDKQLLESDVEYQSLQAEQYM